LGHLEVLQPDPACDDPQVPMEGEPMPGGNSGPVVRLGDVVVRPAGSWTPNVHALMHGLRRAGLPWVPEPVGCDGPGRELIEFIDGDVGIYPMPEWVWSDELLGEVAGALRDVHDAARGLDLPDAGWRRAAIQPTETICHGDIAPYNAVCRTGHLMAFIDWDYAQPAPRGWDLGYAAYRWVSLTPPGHPDGRQQIPAERQRRLELFCSAYGEVTPSEVVDWAIVRLDDLVSLSRRRAAAGDPQFVATVAAGHADLYESDAAWLRAEYGKVT
jgi:hypothetical protein